MSSDVQTSVDNNRIVYFDKSSPVSPNDSNSKTFFVSAIFPDPVEWSAQRFQTVTPWSVYMWQSSTAWHWLKIKVWILSFVLAPSDPQYYAGSGERIRHGCNVDGPPSLGNRPIALTTNGPWSRAFIMIISCSRMYADVWLDMTRLVAYRTIERTRDWCY